MEEKISDRELKFEAIRNAAALHCSPVANKIGQEKPTAVVDTAKQIYEWLKA